MDHLELDADCSRCVGLCCVALAFDGSDQFGFDKAAGEPCRNLTDAHRCAIHERLAERGFRGCAAYDCLGAGQRVTQDLYGGRSWREAPETSREMFGAFRAMRQVHQLLLLLRTAGALPLSVEQEEQRRAFVAQLSPEDGWTPASLALFERGLLASRVHAYLAGLREAAEGLRRAIR